MKNAAKALGSKQLLSTGALNWAVLWKLLEEESREEGVIFHAAFNQLRQASVCGRGLVMHQPVSPLHPCATCVLTLH